MHLYGYIERAQQLVYQKMIESKKGTNHLAIVIPKAFLIHVTTIPKSTINLNRHLNKVDELEHTLKMRLVKCVISI